MSAMFLISISLFISDLSTLKAGEIWNSDSHSAIEESWHSGNALLSEQVLSFVKRPDDKDKLNIAYLHIKNQNFNGHTVLIVPGFAENHYKYSELIYDFYQLGYDLVAMNLRGMGYSDRFPRPEGMDAELHQQTVHISRFSDYSADIKYLLNHEIKDELRGDLHFFAHSTGGLAVLAVLGTPVSKLRSILLNSPLLGLNLSAGQRAVSDLISPLFDSRWPVKTQQKIWLPQDEDFRTQQDTTSEIRWKLYNEFLRKNFSVAQSVPSRGWIRAIKDATDWHQIEYYSKNIRVPTLLLQAGKDSYVDTANQDLLLRAHTEAFKNRSCLKINTFDQEFHSIWRGIHYKEIVKLADTHFKTARCWAR